MKLYNFARLIRKYSVQFHFIVKMEGKWESGKWVDGEPILQEATGAIIPLPESKVIKSGGYYTNKDRQLFMTQPIPNALQRSQVCYKDNVYSIEGETDYADYADVAVYTLKWVSLFNEAHHSNADVDNGENGGGTSYEPTARLRW